MMWSCLVLACVMTTCSAVPLKEAVIASPAEPSVAGKTGFIPEPPARQPNLPSQQSNSHASNEYDNYATAQSTQQLNTAQDSYYSYDTINEKVKCQHGRCDKQRQCSGSQLASFEQGSCTDTQADTDADYEQFAGAEFDFYQVDQLSSQQHSVDEAATGNAQDPAPFKSSTDAVHFASGQQANSANSHRERVQSAGESGRAEQQQNRHLQTVQVGSDTVDIPVFSSVLTTNDGSEVFVTGGAQLRAAVTHVTSSFSPRADAGTQSVQLNDLLVKTRVFTFISDPRHQPIIAIYGGCPQMIDVVGGLNEDETVPFVPSQKLVELADSLRQKCADEIRREFQQPVPAPPPSLFHQTVPATFAQSSPPAQQHYSAISQAQSGPSQAPPNYQPSHSQTTHQNEPYQFSQTQQHISGQAGAQENGFHQNIDAMNSNTFRPSPPQHNLVNNFIDQFERDVPYSYNPEPTYQTTEQAPDKHLQQTYFNSDSIPFQQVGSEQDLASTTQFYQPPTSSIESQVNRNQPIYDNLNIPETYDTNYPLSQHSLSFEANFGIPQYNSRPPHTSLDSALQDINVHSNAPQSLSESTFGPPLPSFDSGSDFDHRQTSFEFSDNIDPHQPATFAGNLQPIIPQHDQSHDGPPHGFLPPSKQPHPGFVHHGRPHYPLPPRYPSHPPRGHPLPALHYDQPPIYSGRWEMMQLTCGRSNKRPHHMHSGLDFNGHSPSSARISSSYSDLSALISNTERPWLAAVLQRDRTTRQETMMLGGYRYLCAGTLVSANMVLTAAHCVVGLRTDELQVRLGDNDLLSHEDDFYPFFISSVVHTFIHPEYSSAVFRSDLALIQLEKPMPLLLVPNIGVVCLPISTISFEDLTSCHVAGWGHDAFRDERRLLKQTEVQPLADDSCELRLRSTLLGANFQLQRNTSFCATSALGQNTCLGDGGAGLVCARGGDDDVSYVVVGVTSWGLDCTGQTPGVYTSVIDHLDWIHDILGVSPSLQQPPRPHITPSRHF